MPAEKSELQQQAFRAMRGATEWLVNQRTSSSGQWRYGDEYSGGKGGFASATEGLTSLLFVRQYERAEGVDLGTSGLPRELLLQDFEWLASAAAGQSYSSEPYITDPPIPQFTDAASFGLTAFILGYQDEALDPLHDLLAERIQECIEWFLENRLDGVTTGAGWTYTAPGEVDPEYRRPQKYFTYATVIALTDYLTETGDLAATHEEAVRAALEDAKEFLIHEARYRDGYANFEPSGSAKPVNYDFGMQLLPTCYTVWAIGYMGRRLPWFTLTDEEHEMLERSLEALDELHQGPRPLTTWGEQYYCGPGRTYEDKTAPYAFFGAFTEYPAAFGGMDDEYEDVRLDIADAIVTDCWAGSEQNLVLGFRHFANTDEIDSDENVAAVYATEVAIESLLAFGLRQPADDTDAVADLVGSVLEDTEERLLEALSGTGVAVPDDEPAQRVERVNKGYGAFYSRAMESVQNQADDLWVSQKLMDEIPKTKSSPEHGTSFPGIHGEKFFEEVVDKCYFETNTEYFRRHLQNYREKHPLVLPSYEDRLARLEELSDEAIRDHERRKEAVRDVVQELEADITGSYSFREIAERLK